MIYSFISLPFCPDPDPGRAKTCGSGSETLENYLLQYILGPRVKGRQRDPCEILAQGDEQSEGQGKLLPSIFKHGVSL